MKTHILQFTNVANRFRLIIKNRKITLKTESSLIEASERKDDEIIFFAS